MRRLQSAHATLQIEHEALQTAHATMASELAELREAHTAQSRLLYDATSRADHAELAAASAMEKCASLTTEVKAVRLAWVESQETLHKTLNKTLHNACASRQESFSNRLAEVSRASRAALEPAVPTSPRTRTPPSSRKVSPNSSPPHVRKEASSHSPSPPTSMTASPQIAPLYAHPRESVPALPPLPSPARGWSLGGGHISGFPHSTYSPPTTAGAPPSRVAVDVSDGMGEEAERQSEASSYSSRRESRTSVDLRSSNLRASAEGTGA